MSTKQYHARLKPKLILEKEINDICLSVLLEADTTEPVDDTSSTTPDINTGDIDAIDSKSDSAGGDTTDADLGDLGDAGGAGATGDDAEAGADDDGLDLGGDTGGGGLSLGGAGGMSGGGGGGDPFGGDDDSEDAAGDTEEPNLNDKPIKSLEDAEPPLDPVQATVDIAVSMLDQTSNEQTILNAIKASIQQNFSDWSEAEPVLLQLWETENPLLRSIARKLMLFILGK